MKTLHNRTTRLLLACCGTIGLGACSTTQDARTGVAAPDSTRAVMAYPTGDSASSALRIEKTVPREIRATAPFTYDMVVTNLTDGTLRNVVIADECTSGLKVTHSEPQARTSGDAGLEWAMGDLGPREARSIRVAAIAPPNGQFKTCTKASYDSTLCMTSAIVQPALKVVRTAPAEALLCNAIPIQYVVTNTGTGTVQGAVLKETLPKGLTTADGLQTVSLNVGVLAAGQSKTFDVSTKAATTGAYEGKALASSAGGLSADSEMVTTVVRQPVLTLGIDGPPQRYLGAPVSFDLVVKNTGDAPAVSTVVEAPLPEGTQLISAGDHGRLLRLGTVAWDLGTLPAGESRTLKMQLNNNSAGTIMASARANATCATEVRAAAKTVVEGIAAVLLEVVDVNDPVLVGENTTYVISVTNQGSKADTGVKIRATLPAEARFVEATGPTAGAANGQVITFAPLATLNPGQKAQWRVTITALKAADSRFRVEMNSDVLEKSVDESEATRFYEFRK